MSVVIAVYNEKENTVELIQRLINIFRSININHPLVYAHFTDKQMMVRLECLYEVSIREKGKC